MKIIQANQGSAVLTTLFILFGILAVSLIGIEIMLSGFNAYYNQGASSIAYYAAETGAERALMLYKREPNFFHDASNSCSDGRYLSFNGGNTTTNSNIDFLNVNNTFCTATANLATYTFPVNTEVGYKGTAIPKYLVKVAFGSYNDPNSSTITWDGSGRVVRLNAQGQYLSTTREIEVVFCVPDCVGVPLGDPDSCGGLCY